MNGETVSLINWLLENLEKASNTNYVDLSVILIKYKAPVTGLAVGNFWKIIFDSSVRCSNENMKTFLMSQKWHKRGTQMEGGGNKDIVRLC